MTDEPRILLVDDDDAIRETLAELLEDEGYEVACATNGADALSKLAAAAAPTVILLDLAMPVMDGWTFRAVQRGDPRLARIPTIVLSASHGVDLRALAPLAPDAFLAKPFEVDRLFSTIRGLCAGVRAAPLATPAPAA